MEKHLEPCWMNCAPSSGWESWQLLPAQRWASRTTAKPWTQPCSLTLRRNRSWSCERALQPITTLSCEVIRATPGLPHCRWCVNQTHRASTYSINVSSQPAQSPLSLLAVMKNSLNLYIVIWDNGKHHRTQILQLYLICLVTSCIFSQLYERE